MDAVKDLVGKNRLVIKVKRKRTENVLFGNAKRLYFHKIVGSNER